jgi:hypothetical protein
MRKPGLVPWDVTLAAVAAAGLIVEGQLRSTGGLPPGDYLLALAAALPPRLALAGAAGGAHRR